MNLFIIIIPVLILLERLFPFRKSRIFRKGIVSDLAWYQLLQEQVFSLGIIAYLEQYPKLHHFQSIANEPFWIQLMVVFLIQDFCAYWYHRYAHSSFLWRFHELHHSSEDVDWLSGVRNHFAEAYVPVIINSGIYFLVFAQLKVAEIGAGIVTVHGFYEHCNIKHKIGWLQYIVISAEMHRCHHLREIKYQKSNYGTVLSIWDWMFGTFYYPHEEDYKDIPFGTDSPYPQNFIDANIHVFRKMNL